MIKKKEVVLNSVAEFLGVWAVRGEASLSLKTKDGITTIAFSHSLSGHPEDPLHPPPAPTGTSPQRRRRRGPARRERDRQRVAWGPYFKAWGSLLVSGTVEEEEG